MTRLVPAIATTFLLAALSAAALPSPKEEWIEVRTPNFTLFSNAGAKNTARIGADLERLRGALAQLSPGLALNSPYPTSLFVFRNDQSFRPYRRLYNGKPQELAGYFLSVPRGNYVAVNGDPRGDGSAIIYHEYLHYVLRNNYASLPVWLNEGMAEFYSTFQVSEGEARIGLPIAHHIQWLRRNPLIPLPELFAITEKSPDYNEGLRRGSFYAQSWALVHYLLAGSPERQRQAVEYLRLVQSDVPFPEAFRQSFGEAAGLESELRNYVKSYLFNYTRAPIQAEADLAIETRPMAWPDVLYRLGDLLANIGAEHRGAAAEHFQAALAAKPDHGPAMAGLGLLEELAGRPAEARTHYAKAARLAPDDLLVQYLYGRNLLELEPGPEELRQARTALGRAVELRPDFGEAWARLGYALSQEDPLPPEAVRVVEKAHELLPSRMDVVHNLALAYAHSGQTQKAEEVITRILAVHAEPDLVASAREALLDGDRRRAEELIGQQKLAEAIPLLEGILAKTTKPERWAEVKQRLDEVRHVAAYNRFVDQYNEAIQFANEGKRKEAIAILGPLAETAADPAQAEQAKTLLTRLLELERKR